MYISTTNVAWLFNTSLSCVIFSPVRFFVGESIPFIVISKIYSVTFCLDVLVSILKKFNFVFFVFLNLKLIGCFNSVLSFNWISGQSNRTQNYAIWGLIAPFLTNQIAGNTIEFKMNVIKEIILILI